MTAEPYAGQRPAWRLPVRALGRRSRRAFAGSALLVLLLLLVELGAGALALAVVLAFVVLPVHLWAVLLLDRLHPEPAAALLWSFLAGASCVVLAAVVLNSGAEVVLALVAGSGTASLLTGVVVAPVVEETGKAAVLLLLHRRFAHEISGPLDGIVYAGMVGLGFATVENVLYYGASVADGTLAEVVVVRGLLSPYAHPLFTACTGIGLGLLVAGRTRLGRGAPALGLLLAIGLHATWNGATELSALAALAVFFGFLLPVFLGLLLLCRREARRQRDSVRRHLQPEVDARVLSPADVLVLSDVRARRRLVRAARRLDPRAGTAARSLAADVLDLADVRARIETGAFPASAGPPELVLLDLQHRVAAARWTLPPPRPDAAEAGLSGALGLPVPR